MRRVLRFLDVDDTVAIDPVQANPAMRVRSQRLHEAVQAVSIGHGPVSEAVKASVKAVTSRRLRRVALHGVRRRVVFAEPPPPDERLMAELRRRLQPEVEAAQRVPGPRPGERSGATTVSERGRTPDFFIVGHPKSGTTALYEMLRAHPQIFMPELKEPVFFAQELPREAHRYRAPATLEEYLALFVPATPRAARRRGLGVIPVVAHGGGAGSPSCARRADRRDPARAGELPALAAPAVPAVALRDRAGSAHGARAGVRSARRVGGYRAGRAGRRCCCTPSTCATSSSCAATTRCSVPSGCWC